MCPRGKPKYSSAVQCGPSLIQTHLYRMMPCTVTENAFHVMNKTVHYQRELHHLEKPLGEGRWYTPWMSTAQNEDAP